MNVLTLIRQSDQTDPARKTAPRAPQIDGATPFGSVMSSLRWSASGGSNSSPQLAADEMFEPRADASTRRLNAMRGNEKLDALREQSRARQQPKEDVQSSDSAAKKVDSVQLVAGELAAFPQTNALQDATLSSVRQSANHPISSAQADPDRNYRDTTASVTIKSQQSGDDSAEAPLIAPQNASATSFPTSGNSDSSANNLARQIGRELGTPRPIDASTARQDASSAALRTNALSNELNSNRNAPTSRAQAAPTDQTPQDAPPDESGPTRFDDLIRAIRIRAGEKNTSARLQLQPPRLGYMEVDVRLEGDQMHIEVRTETDEARRRVHEQSVQLKTALESAGIDVQQINVSVDPDWLRHRGQAGAWMQGSSHEQGGAEQRRPHEKHEPSGPARDGRTDFERQPGTELSSVSALALARGARRVDVRV